MASLAKKFRSDDGSWCSGLSDKLVDAVENYSLPDKGEWDRLSALSANTIFEGIEVHTEAIVEEGSQLIAPGTVYVTLNYGSGDDAYSFFDTYPLRVFFIHSTDEKSDSIISIKRMDVDTSSFYN